MIAAVFLCTTVSAFACTEVYVGSEVSEDGTTIISRSNDTMGVVATYMLVTERVENEPGRTMPVDDTGNVQAEIPATTFHYTSTPFMENAIFRMSGQRDAAACANEYGVSMTMSVTAFSNEDALAADPLVEEGLIEDTADDLVICQSTTAKEAVEILTGLIDKYGSAEVNIATIADQKEAWYIEIYSGHQYAAVKLPADKVAVFGNEFTMQYLSDFEEVITSKNLLTLPEKEGFAKYGESGELDLYATYSGDDIRTDYSHMRTWIGHVALAPSKYGDYDINEFYPLIFEPDKKVSLADVLSVMRNRYEGTPYSPDETGRIDMRVIGTDTALSVHTLQIYPDYPAAMSTVVWESLAPDVYGVFVPLSNLCTGVSEAYGANQPVSAGDDFDSEHYAYYALKEITTIGLLDPRVYGKPVAEFWKKAEDGMQSGMVKVLENTAQLYEKDPSAAAAYITDYCNTMQTQAFTDAKSILNTMVWALNQNSNTLKLAKNPETHEYTEEERVLEPIKIELSAEPYKEVPKEGGKADAEQTKTGKSPAIPIIITIVAAIVAVSAALVSTRKKRQK